MPVNILLVDDHPANLLVLEEVLAGLGENLVRAGSGEEALEKAGAADFAVILLDVLMPTMGGFETARMLRQLPRSTITPIIFLTASEGNDESLREAYSMGAVDFLTKPLNRWALAAKVATFVELHRKREELRTAERQATEERAFLAAVLDAIEDGVVACGPDGVLTMFNRATRELHGLPEAAIPAEDWSRHYDLYGSDGVTPLAREEIPLFRALSGEHVVRAPMVVAPRGKRARYLLASGRPLLGEGGQKLGAVVSMHDVTVTREAEAARVASARDQAGREAAEAAAQELRESQEALLRLAAELSEANHRKSEFLATLAHELRNPLAPIRNGLEVMRLGAADPATVKKTREMVERQVVHLVHLVDDLLDVARISSGKITLKQDVLDLRAIVERAVETSAPQVAAARHVLDVDLPPGTCLVAGDATRLIQVLGNLLNNAAKYTPNGGQIRLVATVFGNAVEIAVSDSGVGIAADELRSVFEMFSQVGNNLERAQGGLGIGLSLVRRLVELHGGTVRAESPGKDQGSTFTVRLPLAPGSDPTSRATTLRAAEPG